MVVPRRLLQAGLLLGAALPCCTSRPPPYALDCALGAGADEARCAHVAEHQQVTRLELTGARELVLTAMSATRTATHLVVDATLQGGFRNPADQNLYLFLGEPTDGVPSRYALTADPQYAADLAYPVRTDLELPHRLDVRVGLMAPVMMGYTPQVYVRDPVRADAVGQDTGVILQVDGARVHVEVPLERYYALTGHPVPRTLGVTLATARDYVGFVDHLTVSALATGDTRPALPRAAEPVLYPSLDTRSHRFKNVTLKQADGVTRVELEMAAPIKDWAQTNLQFFFIPLPPATPSHVLQDAAHAVDLPYAWSWYCAVYSPQRLFCRASDGRDFTYDTAYAERKALSSLPGIHFRQTAPGRYQLESPTASIGAGPEGFALMVAAGRDGFGPTTFYGKPPTSNDRHPAVGPGETR
ncbi:hypothetical protein LXT21_36620 [Myxococcus sp. K38C18041901]|uniref:hypothetical protein n=1 Tax=Myxococcus guangdongensis TaxID=2906760 RepID=UPI0020A83576|nr:hypothetical protein [Myxococcus guangdongensis]MCP3064311.1 hypothetical protein [Myxococcus guangdongensis]